MAIGGVVIQFLADTGKAVGNIKDLTASLGKVDDGSKKSAKGFGKLNTAWLAAVPIAGAVAGGAVALAEGLVDAGQAALEDRAAADKLARTLGRIPGVTEAMIAANAAWVDGMELATGIADTDLREAVQRLALATGDLASAQGLAALAADVATASGKALKPVSEALAKAADGNTAALKRMFPWLDANADGTVTYKEAVDGLTESFGGAAEAAANNAPFKRLKVIWDQLKESVGLALVPLIDKFGKWISDPKNRERIKLLIDKVSALATAFGEDLASAVQDAVTWLSKPENQRAIQEWTRNIGAFASAVAGAASWVEKLWYWIQKLPSNWILRQLGVLPDLQTAPSAQARTAGTAAASAPVVVNVQAGVLGPTSVRQLISLLESHQVRMGRQPGQPRAVAW